MLLPNPYGDLKMDSEDRSTQKDTSSSAVTSSLGDLIARLEKATGPDRELDCLIFELHHKLLTPERRGTYYGEPTGQYFDLDGNPLPERAPFFTSSIDAAMTLVPDGWDFCLCRDDRWV